METTVLIMYPERKINKTQQKSLPSSKGARCLTQVKKFCGT